MNDASALRIAAVFSFLSPLAILAGAPFAAQLGGVGGPGPIDFGDGERLLRLAELGAAPAWVDLSALLGPMFALPAVFGWYMLLRQMGRLPALGTVLWYLGMVFIVLQDALQLALVSTLPASYAAGDAGTRAAIEAVGGSFGHVIETVAFTGHLPNGFGSVLLFLVMWRCATIPKWIAGLGLVSSIIALVSGTLAFLFPDVAAFGIGVPVGIILLLVCIAALGFVMLSEARNMTVGAAKPA